MSTRAARHSDENSTVARGLWLAAAEGDADLLAERMTEDVVWRSYGSNLLSGEFRGREKVIAHIAEFADYVDDCTLDLLQVDGSDRGAVIRYRLRAKRGVALLDTHFRVHLEMEGGRVARCEAIPEEPGVTDRFLGMAY